MTDWWWDTDVKPNNIMILHTSGPGGIREIGGISLSDMEDAARVKNGEAIFVEVGNVLWRSPEAQTGTRVGKASDVWSFGVTVSASLLTYRPGSSFDVPISSFSLT